MNEQLSLEPHLVINHIVSWKWVFIIYYIFLGNCNVTWIPSNLLPIHVWFLTLRVFRFLIINAKSWIILLHTNQRENIIKVLKVLKDGVLKVWISYYQQFFGYALKLQVWIEYFHLYFAWYFFSENFTETHNTENGMILKSIIDL